MRSLDTYDEELNKIVSDKEKLQQQLKIMKVEKKAKLKFLATSLLYATVQEKTQNKLKIKEALALWKSKIVCSKIAESAFNQILELNHKHSDMRFDTACFMLEKVFYN